MSADSKIQQFKKINGALFVANARAGQLFIGRDWTLSPLQEAGLPPEAIFKNLITFLRETGLNLQTGLAPADVETFMSNISTFAQSNPTPKTGQKLERVGKILRGEVYIGNRRIQELLLKPSLNSEERQLLKDALCYLDFERKVLPKLLKLLYLDEQCSAALLVGCEKEIKIIPNTLTRTWQVGLKLPYIRQLAHITEKDLIKSDVLELIVFSLLQLKTRRPDLNEMLDKALFGIKLLEMLNLCARTYEGMQQELLSINNVKFDQDRVDLPLEMLPLLKKGAKILLEHLDEWRSAKAGYAAYDLNDPHLIQTLILFEHAYTSKNHQRLRALVNEYSSQTDEKNALYSRIHAKLELKERGEYIVSKLCGKPGYSIPSPREFARQKIEFPKPLRTSEQTLSGITQVSTAKRIEKHKPLPKRQTSSTSHPSIAHLKSDPSGVSSSSSSSSSSSPSTSCPIETQSTPGIQWVDIAKKGHAAYPNGPIVSLEAIGAPSPLLFFDTHFTDVIKRAALEEILLSSMPSCMIDGWIFLANEILAIPDPAKKRALLIDCQLGSILSRSSHHARKNPISLENQKRISQLSNLQKNLFSFYFHESGIAYDALQPREEVEPVGRIGEIFQAYLAREFKRTITIARDSIREEPIVSISGRMFSFNVHFFEPQLEISLTIKEDKSLPPHLLTEMKINRRATQLLHVASIAYHENSIPDDSRCRESLTRYLLKWVNESEKKPLNELSQMRQLYREALSDLQWEELIYTFSSGKATEQKILEIVGNHVPTASPLMIPIALITCGEMKIALDCIRAAGKLTLEERAILPRHLSDRLTFLSISSIEKTSEAIESFPHEIVTIGDRAARVMKICKKCTTFWPILEGLYSATLETGIAL